MRRRRLIAVVIGAALVAAGAWWMSLCPLSAEEERLVGVWQVERGLSVDGSELLPDRRWRQRFAPLNVTTGGVWSARNGLLVLDYEPNRLRRALRPVAPLIGLRVAPTQAVTV